MRQYIIALGIVALLIGVATTPAISTTIIQSNSNHHTLHQKQVEINVQLCGITEQENNTLELSEHEAQKLAHLMNNIKKTFENATTDDEILTAFHNAIVTLKQHNLLPSGMSVQQAEQLVTASYTNSDHLETIFQQTANHVNLSNHNFLCLIAGKSDSTFFTTMILQILFYTPLFVIPGLIELINPIWIGSLVGIGYVKQTRIPPPDRSYPAHGWIHTYGLLAHKQWNDSFTGGFFPPFWIGFNALGIIGFTGIKIAVDVFDGEEDRDRFYFGSALWVCLK